MARYESWASLEISVLKVGQATKIHTLVQAVSYSDSLETELVRGTGRDILGTTDPVYLPGDMSIEFLFRWWRTFIADLTNNGETKIGDHDMRMVLKHLVRGSADTPMVDEVDYIFTGAEDTREQGPEKLITVVQCQPTLIKRNGVQL